MKNDPSIDVAVDPTTISPNGHDPAEDDAFDLGPLRATSPVEEDEDALFDIEALRSAAPTEVTTERRVLAVPARRPSRTEFFQVNPDPAFWLDCPLLETEEKLDRILWWISPTLRDKLGPEAKNVRLFTCVNSRGTPFLWPCRLPGAEGGGTRWYSSALAAAEIAKAEWVKLVADKDAGAYSAFIAKGNLGTPRWPELSFKELIRLAFRDHAIDREDHDVIRRLEGRLT